MTNQNPVVAVVEAVGGAVEAAKICKRSRPAIDKWVAQGHLPRTEYTGETHYAEVLAEASGGKFTAKEIREQCRPGS